MHGSVLQVQVGQLWKESLPHCVELLPMLKSNVSSLLIVERIDHVKPVHVGAAAGF